jgi:uncharacterized protein YegJ (DUF2314 family)
MRFHRTAFLILAISCLPSCRRKAGARVERAGEPDFIPTQADDRELEAAKRQARQTLPEFVKALEAPPPGSRAFAIKKGFGDGKNDEFIWLDQVKLAGQSFQATVANVPVWFAGVRVGDQVEVKREEVADWMYIDDRDTLVGGFTIRVLFRREPPEKRRELEREAGFKIPPS